MATAERVLALYQEKYPDFKVRHFHQKLKESEDISLNSPGEASVAGPGPSGPHRRRRPRRPMPGMPAAHRREQTPLFSGRLLVILDNATL